MCGELNDVEGRPRLNADEWPPCANNGNLSLCQNTSKGRKCLHQLWENMKLVNHEIFSC